MKARTVLVSAAVLAMLTAGGVHAQVLGGGLTGGLTGGLAGGLGSPLSGGVRDLDVLAHGDVTGSLDAQSDFGAVHRVVRGTRGAGERVTGDARSAASALGKRTASQVNDARNTATTAAATATSAASTAVGQSMAEVQGAARLAGSAAANADGSGSQLATDVQSGLDGSVGNTAQTLPVSGADDGSTSESAGALPAMSEPRVAGDVLGSMSGDASVSRDGVAAHSSANASAGGTAKR